MEISLISWPTFGASNRLVLANGEEDSVVPVKCADIDSPPIASLERGWVGTQSNELIRIAEESILCLKTKNSSLRRFERSPLTAHTTRWLAYETSSFIFGARLRHRCSGWSISTHQCNIAKLSREWFPRAIANAWSSRECDDLDDIVAITHSRSARKSKNSTKLRYC